MIVNLSSIIKNEGFKLDFDTDIKVDEAEFMGTNYKFLTPIHVEGIIQNNGDTFTLDADTAGTIQTSCFRCMKKIEQKFHFTLHEVLANDENVQKNDEEIIRFEGSNIDIRDIVINNILINLPVKYLCSENCEGLCPKCGKDLNIDKCNCIDEDIDPRLEALKKLL